MNDKSNYPLAEETTPGGLNYMAKEYIAKQGGFDHWAETMDNVHAILTSNRPNSLE